MTDDIEAIRSRWAKATPGPWESSFSKVHQPNGNMVADCLQGEDGIVKQSRLNAEAIAAAPEDIATLLAEIDRLREENEQLSGLMEYAFNKDPNHD